MSKGARLALWVGSGGLVAAAGGLLGFWLFLNIALRLTLSDQPALIQMPPSTAVTLSTSNKLDVQMKGIIHAKVPLQQTLQLPLKGRYMTQVTLDAPVTLETTINYKGIVPIDTYADIVANVPLNYKNVKQYKNLQLKARLPMKLRVPMTLSVPLKQTVRIRYKGPLGVSIDHLLNAPVGTTLDTQLKVDQFFELPVTSRFGVNMQIPQAPVRATIHHADLYLPLKTLRAERKAGDAAP